MTVLLAPRPHPLFVFLALGIKVSGITSLGAEVGGFAFADTFFAHQALVR